MTASTQLLIQVVPKLTPSRCGVSDQAVLLARELQTRFGIDTAFAVLNSNERSSFPFAAFYCHASELPGRSLELTQGRPAAMLIHVSGYGYSADGAPTLLADALQKMTGGGHFRAAAYFHEVIANGPPWTSAFWHSHRQKKAVRRIIARCELVVTSIGLYADWLKRESLRMDGPQVELMPVFSPGGESDAPVPFEQRDATMVVFGLAGTRRKAYAQLATAEGLVQTLNIEEIQDIGPECDHPAMVHGIPVKRLGQLPGELLPEVFSRAQFGFVTHPWSCLGKSSVLAAYCAQGTIPVHSESSPGEVDGLREGVHVITPRTANAVRGSGWAACSHAAWSWYSGHRLHLHAVRYANWMGGVL